MWNRSVEDVYGGNSSREELLGGVRKGRYLLVSNRGSKPFGDGTRILFFV